MCAFCCINLLLIPLVPLPLLPSFHFWGRDSEEKLKELTKEEKDELRKQENQR